jgi:tetratricopeptide (TPR) repeat protein
MVVLLVAGAAASWAQIPDKFENLTVLPKDISKQDLMDVMRNWSMALGARCHTCHVGEPGPSLEGYDFKSDEKGEKRTARQMFRMVKEINSKHIAGLEVHHGVQVGCRTCHHGQELPRSLTSVLDEVHGKDGLDAALAKYAELRERYYGSDSYDFGEWALDGLAEKWLKAEKPKDALALMEVHAGHYPESSHLQFMLGELLFRSGDKDKAVPHLKKALELDPGNRMAKRRLGMIEGG